MGNAKIGLVAACLTTALVTFGLPAQIVRVIERGSAGDLSLVMVALQSLGFFAWTVFGLTVKPRKAWAIIAPNGLGFIASTVLLVVMLVLSG